MRLRAIGIAILLAAVVAGCGSSSGGGATASIPTAGKGPGGAPTGIVTNAVVAVGGNSHHYVTAPGPLIAVQGFIRTSVSASNSATKWVHTLKLTGSFARKDLALLNRDGFKIGVVEDLWLKRDHISTLVQRFAASVGPTDAVSLETARVRGHKGAKHFTVSGIPGAIGYKVGGNAEVYFSSGDYYVQLTRNATGKAAITQLTGVAATIYKELQA